MVRKLIERFRDASRGGGASKHVTYLLPFLIISLGLGVLAWHSYRLSVRMEAGANQLAIQYARYSADMMAKSIDAAVQAELQRTAEDWQQSERRVPEPTPAVLEEWAQRHDWVVSAIFIPDWDPSNSFFVTEIATPEQKADDIRNDFFSSTGSIRYTYDPARLIARVRNAALRQAAMQQGPPSGGPLKTVVEIVAGPRASGLEHTSDGHAYIATLARPLHNFAVRSFIPTSYAGSGWQNQRLVSLALSVLALMLTALGGLLAYRGMHKEAETMKLRGALIANVSHELRTPLSMIRLGAETLRRAKRLTEKERGEIEDQILREVLVLSHLVENVLDVARIQNRSAKALAFTPVMPRDLVRTLVSTYESWIRSKGFAIDLDLDETIEEQMWDRDAVSRALLNLIDNAIKYSGDDNKRIEVILRQTAEHVVLEVKDHGIGIDAKDLQAIFDPYFRATFSDTQTRRGAGLGLTLVQQILASHGGRVEVESEKGSGSTFRLLFPRNATEESRAVAGRLIQAPGAF